MPEWTPRQSQAILARNKDILVSAAAGSGKTAVLIERVMSLMKEGHDLERMLVMTFTHAAADEMKERLTQRLVKEAGRDEHLRRQFLALGRADISTLHSFCGRLLRRHFQAADTDPLSRQLDEAQAGELFDLALDEALDSLHENPDEEQLSLVTRFTEAEILEMVKALYRFLMAMDEPFTWLETALTDYGRGDLYSHPWYRVMKMEAGLKLSGAEDLALRALALCQLPEGPGRNLTAAEDDLRLIRSYRARLMENQPFTWVKPSFTRLSTRSAPPEEDPALYLLYKDQLRAEIKNLINKALELLPQDSTQAAAWMKGVQDTAPQLRALSGLVQDTARRYQAMKAARAYWDFNDLEHLTLKALKDPLVLAEVGKRYDALFVDEYQDISRTQEAIIKALRGEGCALFMVGDVKQSIYRFRLADPSLFLHKHRDFSQEPDSPRRLITLKENFRSDPNILSAVNLVFELAMREKATEITYDEDARLHTLSTLTGDAPVELHLLEKAADTEALPQDRELQAAVDQLMQPLEPEGEDEEEDSPRDLGLERAFVYEARLVAERVAHLVEEGVRYRDIAILLRSAKNRASVMAEILNARGIPTYSDADGEFYTQSDVRDVMNLLQVMDNPLQDLPLLSALASPAFSFNHDDLADLALFAREQSLPLHQAFLSQDLPLPKMVQARETLERWRLLAATMPLPRFLPLLMRESGLYAVAGAKEEGALRRANLRILVGKAAPNPEPQNLSDFVERYKRALKQNRADRSASLGMQEDVVRIMTLHKSKGLQFPVVILPNLAAAFSKKPSHLPLFMDAATGLALTRIDPQLRAKSQGFGVKAIKVKKRREEISEEARLLYVGMTRAKHRLIMVGTPPEKKKGFALPPGDYAAAYADSMLDWVCAPLAPALDARQEGLYEAPGGSRWMLSFRDIHTLPETRVNEEERPEIKVPEGLGLQESPFTPPFVQQEPLQLKSSVTALISRAREAALEETPEIKRRGLKKKEQRSTLLPKIEQGLSPAQRGAAAHKALCALNPADFAGLPLQEMLEKLGPALLHLKERGLLSLEEHQAVDPMMVVRFYESSLAVRLAHSKERYAEWAFTLEADRDLLLQGVLDACFVEDGAWVLVDYKTDRGEKDELLARYTPQMRWYMRALTDITGMPVKEAWLYLLRKGDMVQVVEDAPITLRPEDLDALQAW